MQTFVAILRTAFAESWANRATFLFDALMMMLNNAVWLLFWTVFFNQTGTIRGWNTHRVFVLVAMLAFVVGLTNGFFDEARKLGRAIANGEIDGALLRPCHALISLIPRTVNAVSIGDAIFGVVLFSVTTKPNVLEFALFVCMGTLGCLVCTSILVLASSLTFFFRNDGAQGTFVSEAISILSFYPTDIFGKAIRFVLATVIPVSFVATIPARAVLDVHMIDVVATICVAAILCGLAVSVFNAGLRRYSSSAGWVH